MSNQYSEKRPLALNAINRLRLGLPPTGFVRRLTVGRKDELAKLKALLDDANGAKGNAMLLAANYGAGKTHLIQYLRELALDKKYVVSTFDVDPKAGIRFNRMDQMVGEICRQLEMPANKFNSTYQHIGDFFNFLATLPDKRLHTAFQQLRSNALKMALSAWRFGDDNTRNLVTDWLTNPAAYKGSGKKLKTELYDKNCLARPDEWRFDLSACSEFMLDAGDNYLHCWQLLAGLHTLAQAAGFKGLVVLFDEFERSVIDLKNQNYQKAAFANLFKFYDGSEFPGKSFYATTPQFSESFRWLYPREFKQLPMFGLPPLAASRLLFLAKKGILPLYCEAYPKFTLAAESAPFAEWIKQTPQIEDRARQAIKNIVEHLDEIRENAQ
ncbi:hypothetical protein FACS1894139_18980 [Planctomycetales bacterium]|nr:hypothetical protein FACS1894107_13040 [Planctomycetales bacterium]GHT08912.1 hypothetical protein FACS1894139_18980 [Planctomycetales bacterium]